MTENNDRRRRRSRRRPSPNGDGSELPDRDEAASMFNSDDNSGSWRDVDDDGPSDGSDDGADESDDSGSSLDPEDAETWADVRRCYGMLDNEDGRYAAVTVLRERYDLMAVRGDDDTLYRYHGDTGIYEEGAEYDIGRELDAELGRYYSQHERREILGRLKEHVVDRDELNAGEHDSQLVCVKNGVLDVETRELHEHDPEYRFTNRLPVEYNPDAEPDTYDEFTNEITRREADAKTLNELLGNALLDDYRYEYVLFLFGGGANGKSTWLSVVRALLGEENTSSETLQRLAENRFSSARLVGKMANIAEDLPQRKIDDMGTIKDLSGGGMVPAEKKNQDPFDFRNRAKLMFAANSPPVLGERTWAVKRRLAPVYLPYRFVDDPADLNEKQREYGLEDDLTTDEELSGILNRALDGLDRLREHGDISLPEDPDERLDLYERHSDHIKAFAVDCLTNTTDSFDQIRKDRIYSAYTRYCEANGEEPVANQTFWRQLRRTTLDVETSRPRRDGDRVQVLERVAWKETAEEYLPADCEVGGDSDADNGDEDGEVSQTPISDILEGTATKTLPKPVQGTVSESGVSEIGDGTKIQLVAGFDVVDVIDWDGDHDLEQYVGKTIQIIRAQAGEYDGTKQIEVIPESSITVVEEPADGQQTGLDDAADDGDEPTQAERIDDVQTAVDEMAPAGDGALAAALADDYDPETVTATLEKLAEQGDIHDPDGDGWRPT
ncbi:phage/plasmid primase, P4 family, C-terminal domain-containing protein [Halobiforma haloterrestris]|uniref:Phage/plasmid primase, P4 family, C-terminal domain-containing protein n=1 Tax=Natronobacterium haloterrestre TaxID=148448 RepID=A0A1I1LPX9_NATHA|nr:DNA primase family protein [Halobiforma haloterrestris]SFC75121.1 phage/plasmid primase, P4 family, C-terminal domain-containing protein [Halobiforma haloterrestris]